MKNKRSLGQFFTKRSLWLKDHILDFIISSKAKTAFDPFAGGGDLLATMQEIGFLEIIGFDIDDSLSWQKNDSLINIPKIKNSIIITNPPYLTNYSAKRMGIYGDVKKYFDICKYDDLYQLAVEKCLTSDFGVMLIPETFINSSFPKHRLTSITIIEDVVFEDTENPICVICFDNKIKDYAEIKVYKNGNLLGNLKKYEQMRKLPNKKLTIKFNSIKGQIALRAVDGTNPQKSISFMKPEEIDYDLSTIKESSRLITLIEMKVGNERIEKIINRSNLILSDFRTQTHDILLSPFKGNKKNGERRRRLDYSTARAILEDAYEIEFGEPKKKLFNLN